MLYESPFIYVRQRVRVLDPSFKLATDVIGKVRWIHIH
jgi:hypothetical protein